MATLLNGCAFAPKPIDDAVPKNGVTCFVGETGGSGFTQFTSCEPDVIRKETKSPQGADLIFFRPAQRFVDDARGEIVIIRVVSPAQLKKGEKDTMRKYPAAFGNGVDKYSDSLHIDDSNCTFSMRVGKDGNERVWRLTHINIIRGSAGMTPQLYCAKAKEKWEEPRAFIRISTEKVSTK